MMGVSSLFRPGRRGHPDAASGPLLPGIGRAAVPWAGYTGTGIWPRGVPGKGRLFRSTGPDGATDQFAERATAPETEHA
ncbi:hypothetical protein GCM10010327_52990 [Streptomyces nitrosporeus]|nr:hypothetical protein GCM10010327_52990 [Streptomyces nitrosporeus]